MTVMRGVACWDAGGVLEHHLGQTVLRMHSRNVAYDQQLQAM
jgi:hypothetical protein